jgi:hypothetical protein
VCGFLWVLRLPSTIKLTATILLKYTDAVLNYSNNTESAKTDGKKWIIDYGYEIM